MFGWLKKKASDETPTDHGLMSERHKFIEDQQALSIPWAMFEIVGFEDDGRIKVEFNWNNLVPKSNFCNLLSNVVSRVDPDDVRAG